jgi:Dyp-type peroxidase family
VALGLTAAGLDRLGAPAVSGHAAFRAGAEARAPDLGDTGDSAPDRWRFGNGAHPVDAVVTIAADDLDVDLAARRDRVGVIAAEHGAVIGAELRGARLAGGREHFGFRDGMGQPRVAGFDPTGIAPGEFVLGWRPEPPGRREKAQLLQNASFQVVRQLEQHVDRWRSDGLDAGDADAWGAARVGRWPDGDFVAPVPASAHIRKTLPAPSATADPARARLLRRGIPYGGSAGAERGLVFNAFMADISGQFERVQRWANAADGTDPDGVIGVPYHDRVPPWPRYVTTRGTVYAVALSRPALARLAGA